ncbi:yqaJ domain-containing protein [Trichonephila clavipes]|nr:yqaJ domain-containing protein [Trichonephila clavipes]
MYNTSPENFVKSIERKRENDVLRRKRKTPRRQCRKSLFLDKRSNKNYGVNTQKPDLSESPPPLKKEWFLSTICLSDEEIKDIERTTINQTSPLWKRERRKRLTVLDFGVICKKLPHSSCEGESLKKPFIRISNSQQWNMERVMKERR